MQIMLRWLSGALGDGISSPPVGKSSTSEKKSVEDFAAGARFVEGVYGVFPPVDGAAEVFPLAPKKPYIPLGVFVTDSAAKPGEKRPCPVGDLSQENTVEKI